MNLTVLRKTRRRVENGDIFTFQLKQEQSQYRFGRVVNTKSRIGGFIDTILIYLYSATSANKLDIPLLDFKNLLVPPMATNQIPWSKGYFEHLENRPLKDREILGQHYFKSHARGKVFDEYGCEVLNPCGPVGEFGLQSYRTIDDKISEALEYPLSDQT